jgi:signal transduction histidine kinase
VLDGDEVMERVDAYITNVSNLIPDSITQQNIWANGPFNSGSFGIGISGSLTMFNKKSLGGIVDSTQDFTGKGADLQSFPTNIPFLPAASIDMRFGGPTWNSSIEALRYIAYDIGLSGFVFDSSWVSLLPEGNRLFYWTAGADLRVSILQEWMLGGLSPSLFVQGGYFFSSFDWSFEAKWNAEYDGGMRDFDEYVNMLFRTQTFFGAVQVAKKLFIFTPFFGYKVIICDKDTDFTWGTSRSVSIQGNAYPLGLDYQSAGNNGDYKFYHEIYGGVSVSFLFPQFLTIGAAYNLITEHFGANVAIRLSGGSSREPDLTPKQPKVKPAAKTEEDKLAEREAALEKARTDREEAAAKTEAEQRRQAELQARRKALAEREAEEARIRQAEAEERRRIIREERMKVLYPAGITYGNLLINGGIGLGLPLRAAASIPPYVAALDYALPLFGQPFTLGGMGSLSTEKGDGYTSTHLSAAFRIAWHPGILRWILPDQLDLYAAGVLGLSIGLGEKTTANFLPGLLTGARWYFDRYVGVYAELGYSPLYIFNLGATLRF